MTVAKHRGIHTEVTYPERAMKLGFRGPRIGAALFALFFTMSQLAHADTTTILVGHAGEIDQKMQFADGNGLDLSVELRVTFDSDGDGTPEDHDVSVDLTIMSDEYTRRELAEEIATQIQEQLGEGEGADKVSTFGSSVMVKCTPPGEGENTGTPEDPKTSGDKNKVQLKSYTK